MAQFYDRLMTKWKPGYGSRKLLTIIIIKGTYLDRDVTGSVGYEFSSVSSCSFSWPSIS